VSFFGIRGIDHSMPHQSASRANGRAWAAS
jgi:hypothetical protein